MILSNRSHSREGTTVTLPDNFAALQISGLHTESTLLWEGLILLGVISLVQLVRQCQSLTLSADHNPRIFQTVLGGIPGLELSR